MPHTLKNNCGLDVTQQDVRFGSKAVTQRLPFERLLSGHTGRSPLRLSGDASGCFRPTADIGLARHILLLQESVGQIQ
jgi:hypothetical protein